MLISLLRMLNTVNFLHPVHTQAMLDNTRERLDSKKRSEQLLEREIELMKNVRSSMHSEFATPCMYMLCVHVHTLKFKCACIT